MNHLFVVKVTFTWDRYPIALRLRSRVVFVPPPGSLGLFTSSLFSGWIPLPPGGSSDLSSSPPRCFRLRLRLAGTGLLDGSLVDLILVGFLDVVTSD